MNIKEKCYDNLNEILEKVIEMEEKLDSILADETIDIEKRRYKAEYYANKLYLLDLLLLCCEALHISKVCMSEIE
ncbi:MAG: hypothetical protein AB1478_01710 [Nitrospirota bacterium]